MKRISFLLLVSIHQVGTICHAQSGLTLYESVCREAREITGNSLAKPLTPDEWKTSLAERREKWLEMLGISPLPKRTPLEVTVTGTLERGDYVVEKLHFQSSSGAHVAGNLYRPAKFEGKLPTVLYLCGHTKGKVNGIYQANPRWFGQHGYVALVLDPVQLGESQGMHFGTFKEDRWDWPSRGYTPAGLEVWNAMRALDYLESRDDVDPARMGVTGLSGGGAMSWFLGAADERVKVVVPVCQSGSIERVGVDRSTDGHCDCAFWINYYRWCWPDIGALIAPRPFLIASGSEDILWRPAGYRDVAHRIRHQYAALAVPENFDLVESLSNHGYTAKLRRAIFTFFNTHLKNDPTPVEDDITDFVEPEENLLVFGGNLPKDDQMMTMDSRLAIREQIPLPNSAEEWRRHQMAALDRLQATTFRNIPKDREPRLHDKIADGRTRFGDEYASHLFDTTDGLTLAIRVRLPRDALGPVPTVLSAISADAMGNFVGSRRAHPGFAHEFASAAVEVRNTGVTSVGPGYLVTLRRMYALLGHTLPERQVHDLLAGAALMRCDPATGPIAAYGREATATLAIYTALLDPKITEILLQSPPETHEDPTTAEFLGVLRIGDLPQNLALFYPRPITFIGKVPPAYEWTRQVYGKLGQGNRFREVKTLEEWKPEG